MTISQLCHLQRGAFMGNDKITEKKRLKMTKLYDAAYELFTSNGVHNTIIDDIVKRAGVAKGTFYLYCKDKYDLVDKIILKKSSALLNNALEAVEKEQQAKDLDFQQCVIFFVDYLIEFFRKDVKLLELIYKNLSWELYEKVINYAEIDNVRKLFIVNFMNEGGNGEAAKQRLYIIVSMVGSVCYNSIVLKCPYQLNEIKPELYHSIKQILT